MKKSGESSGSDFRSDLGTSEAFQRYRSIMNSVDDGIYQVDADGRFVAVNDAIVETTGYTRDELLGEHVSRLVSGDDVQRIERTIRRRLAADEGDAEPIEFSMENAEGDVIVCELRLNLLLDDGDFRGTVGIVRDITDCKQAEERLKERETQLQRERDLVNRLLDTSPIGIQVVGADGEIKRMNERGKELLGADEVDSYSPSDRRVYDETGRPITVDEHPFARALESGDPVYDEIYQIGLPDGDRRWLSVSAAPVFDDDGDIDRVVTTGEDITDLKERERKLEADRDTLEAKLDEVYERINDGFYAVDDQWRFTHVNERTAELFGVPESALLGKNLWEMFPEAKTAEGVEESLRTAMEQQERTEFEVYSELLGFWIEARIYPSETGLSVYFTDITERKEYERQLEEANERLEQFAYAASHDLQEPLRMVSSYLRLIEREYADEFDEEGLEFVDFAVDGADRMREMVQGLLEYSRVEMRGDPFEPTDLDAVFDDVLADLRVKIAETDAEITVDELPRVDGDASQLRQLFQNLLDNAIVYRGDEPPRIHVSAELEGSEWIVSVRDDGIGIDPENTDRIFDVFERLHGRDEYSGAGIGLALCERIVERHGGEIWIDSEPGGGTTVSVTLPKRDDAD